MDAYPPPENFKWSFNNTAETFDMPQSGFRAHSAQGSTLTYTPVKVSVFFFFSKDFLCFHCVTWIDLIEPIVYFEETDIY